MWTLRRWNSWSRSSTLIDSGTKTGVRRIARSARPLADARLQERQQVLGVEDPDDLVDRVLVDRDPAVALLDDDVDRLLHRRVDGEGDHRDPRHHHLVDALVAELDDRVDHLLLLGLEDALLAAALDEDLQLFGAHHAGFGSPAPSSRATLLVTAVRTRTSGPRTRSMSVMNHDSRSANASAWASARLLGTSSPNTIVNRLRSERHDDECQRLGRAGKDGPRPVPSSAVWRCVVRLTAAYAEARKPMNVSPIWVTARNRPGWLTRCLTRRAL